MIRLIFAVIFAAVLSLNAETQPRGAGRLRELVVFPEINFTCKWGINFEGSKWMVYQNEDLPSAITGQREKLKLQPDDVDQLLRLAYLLDSNDETNESKSCYQKVEQLCRNKIVANPQNGLSLMALGEALDALGNEDEAENDFRKSTLISSNEWRCWVGLGDFLQDNSFGSMFSKDLRNMIAPGQMPPQAVLDYRPSPDILNKSEAMLDEASRCFDRAMTLGPKEPEVFFQRAGYMSMSNLQNCYIRYYRNNEKISTSKWLSAFFSKETVANLKKAAELDPKDYQYVSLAAYFEYLVPMLQSKMQPNAANFTADMLPDTTRQSIHNTLTHLENLSQSSDTKMAAGALENLGMLNMMLGNKLEAATDFRRAVAIDPTREQSWDMWLGSIKNSASPEELVAVCELRLKQKDSARNHLLLARAFQEYEKKWDKSAEQAQAAIKLEPENLVAHLELTALALKQSADTNFMAEAVEQFNNLNAIWEKIPDNKKDWEYWREWTLNLAIYDILVNTPEYEKAAKTYIENVLKSFPNDKQAMEISNAME
jgi:tetratricopeptide (TPR) repeat protein